MLYGFEVACGKALFFEINQGTWVSNIWLQTWQLFDLWRKSCKCKIKPCSHFYKTAFSQTNPRLRTPKGHPILAESRHKSFLWAALQILHCRCDFAGFHADFRDILSSSPSSSEGLLKFPKKNFALKLVLLPWRQANWLDSWCSCTGCFQLPHTPCSESELD